MKPDPIPTYVVRDLQSLCGPEETITNAKPKYPDYEANQRVRVIGGPLIQGRKKFLEGICLSNSKDRVRILLDILAMPVEIPKEYIAVSKE
jgi:hypothetical protein